MMKMIIITILMMLIVGCRMRRPSDSSSNPNSMYLAISSHDSITQNCNSCHDKDRPQTTIFPTPDLQVKEHHYGQTDCASCHQTKGDRYPWAFDHKDGAGKNIRFCLPCHDQRGEEIHPKERFPSWYKGEGKCFKCHAEYKSWKFVREKR